MSEEQIITVVKVVRDSVWRQWIVKVWDQNGVRMPEAYYYTDNKQDAINTAKAMVKKEN